MLTPLEIQNRKYKKKIWGYSALEVDEFMLTVCGNYERLYANFLTAKERIDALMGVVQQYKSMEESLQSALVTAQATGEEVRRSAQEKAEYIVARAEAKAERIVSDAETAVTHAGYRYEELKRNTDVFKAKITAMFAAHLEMLKDFELEDENEDEQHESDLFIQIPANDQRKTA